MKSLLQYSLIILISASLSNKICAQEIIWASEVIFQYNAFKKQGPWSGEMILGAPDAYPYGSLNEKAFRLISEDAYGTITLGFQSTKVAKEILIAENFAPGRVTKVIVFDTNGTEYVVFEKVPQELGVFSRLLSISLEGIDFVINKVTVHLNTIGNNAWSQIDAVGLSYSQLNNEQKLEITKSDQTIIEEELTFSAERELLDGSINTPYREIKPVISPDGRTLYFARRDYPENIGGKRDPQDIYYSDFVNGKWRLAQNVGSPLNDDEPNGVCSISPDGNTMVVINSYKEDGSVEGKGASFSFRTASGWTQPIKIEIEEFYNKNEYEDYFLSNSGKFLVMAIETKGGFGDQDMFVSFRNEDGTFSTPKNLGSTLNTSSVEYSPFLASDNRTLYFSSDGHGGEGGSDIFYTRRLDESWTKWTKPQNIGPEVNSEEWDAYYTVTAKGDYAYFVSINSDENNSAEAGDIFRISLSKDIKPDPVVLMTGRVLDKKTNRPIEAEINYESLNNDNEDGIAKSNPEDGAYKIVMPIGNLYGFLAKAKGYISVFENEDFTEVKEYKEIEKNLYLVPIEIGQVVQLNNLFFVQSKPDILPESETELERLYSLMAENPDMEIELKGHTDNQGYFKANMKLSDQRAEAVMNYLIERGVSKKRMKSKGYGPTQPLYPNNTLESRAKNRRVEIEITGL